MKKVHYGPLVYMLPVIVAFIVITPLPLWYFGSMLSEKIKYVHLLTLIILLYINCQLFWCSRTFIKKKAFFAALVYLTSAVTIILGIWYGYYICSN